MSADRCANSRVPGGIAGATEDFPDHRAFSARRRCPPAVIEHVARRLGVESGSTLIFPDRTLYRHRPVILKRLEVVSWGAEARKLAQATMRKTAQARTDPADIINSAIDALIRNGFELPALDTLRRLAATVHSKVNAAQWSEVCDCLPFEQRVALETMLVVDPKRRNHHLPICARHRGGRHAGISTR